MTEDDGDDLQILSTTDKHLICKMCGNYCHSIVWTEYVRSQISKVKLKNYCAFKSSFNARYNSGSLMPTIIYSIITYWYNCERKYWRMYFLPSRIIPYRLHVIFFPNTVLGCRGLRVEWGGIAMSISVFICLYNLYNLYFSFTFNYYSTLLNLIRIRNAALATKKVLYILFQLLFILFKVMGMAFLVFILVNYYNTVVYIYLNYDFFLVQLAMINLTRQNIFFSKYKFPSWGTNKVKIEIYYSRVYINTI